MNSDSRRLAVLIDGDFINPAHFGRVFAWAARSNEVIIRRIYGDHDKLEHWKECISNHGIESVPSYAKYKNAADIVLAVHAAEILYSNKEIGGFCIVTNDNDFAGLVKWIRDKGAYVAVVWSSSKDKHTPSFEDECNDFEYIDKLPPSDNPDPAARRKLSGWKEAVREAVYMPAREGGWALLSDVGSRLKEAGRGSDYRAYCHGDLLSLVRSCPEFETETGPDRVRSRSPA